MAPQKLEIENNDTLKITWDDNSVDKIKLVDLRKNCPCAICSSQEPGSDEMIVRRYTDSQVQVASISPVGQYAINIIWKDGHDTGIYEYDYLKELSEKFKVD